MALPNGTTRTTGYSVMLATLVFGFFGYSPSEVAPIEMARFADDAVLIAGLVVALYGEYRAKAPMWFSKNK